MTAHIAGNGHDKRMVTGLHRLRVHEPRAPTEYPAARRQNTTATQPAAESGRESGEKFMCF